MCECVCECVRACACACARTSSSLTNGQNSTFLLMNLLTGDEGEDVLVHLVQYFTGAVRGELAKFS